MSLTFLGCDGHTTASGQVVNPDGEFLEGTRVILEDPGSVYGRKHEMTTDKDGKYGLGLTHAPGHFQLKLKASKEGYQDYEEPIETGTNESGHIIVLQPDPMHENEE